jgi:predicted MFS family arabinose efflux permease
MSLQVSNPFSFCTLDFDINPVAQDIKEGLERDRIAKNAVGWKMILSPTPAIKRMLFVGIGVAVAQQAVGIDAIQYYLLDVLQESGIQSEKTQLVVLILLGGLKLLFVIVGSKLLDNRGRKKLLFISLIGKFCCCLLLFPVLGDRTLQIER